MARLISKFFLVALVTVAAILTFASLFDTLPRNPYASYDPDPIGGQQPKLKDESLLGALPQKPAVASPPPFVMSEETPAERQAKEEEVQKTANAKKEQELSDRMKIDEDRVEKYSKYKVHTGDFTVPKDLKHDPNGPKPNEIVILAASDGKGHNGGIPHILEDINTNRQEYADFQGYTYQFLNISKYDVGMGHAVWAKLPALVETFNLHPEAKWIWWLDLDAIIMTPTVDLRTHLLSFEALGKKMLKGVELNKPRGYKTGIVTPKVLDPANIDLVVSQDHNGINAGSFLIRRSNFSRMFIDMWSDPLYLLQGWIAEEQDALEFILREHPTVLEHTAVINQKAINSYPVTGIVGMSWEKGDLVVHLAGCWVKNTCKEQWAEFMAKRTTVADIKKAAAAAAPPKITAAAPPKTMPTVRATA